MESVRTITLPFSFASSRPQSVSLLPFRRSQGEASALQSVAESYDMYVFSLFRSDIENTRAFLGSLADGYVPSEFTKPVEKKTTFGSFRSAKYRAPPLHEIRKFATGRGLVDEVSTVVDLLESLYNGGHQRYESEVSLQQTYSDAETTDSDNTYRSLHRAPQT
ncbi:hypothetical protein L486_01803 [Kwoniella mangroviensis CBS 10435]|uniref:Uncharacterized protein n=1 Tax=Kwoniella mangroviensis CBS 10435 TaxID=1331196 RepID=A0A1B9J2X1_9TREE|nr:hypothetical protein L486_01803 [Kwoniella mangroviensis CBS 10435]